ncbi:hypothetical protein BC830DRAFT_1261846 [Chytriomyces sp. MP71]|nr:hypothetical protein BC830DRAFT_1261846 [Chytriomyces sp. MP71]
MTSAVVFRSVSADLAAVTDSLSGASNIKTVLIIGEKGALTSPNAIPFAPLGLAHDFIAPIADGLTDHLKSFVGGKAVTVATVDDKKSRTLGPVRGDSILEVVGKHAGNDGDAIFIVRLSNDDQILTAAIAIARAFPTFARKQKETPERTIHVHFVLAVEPKATVDVAKIQVVADAVRNASCLVDTPPNELNPTTYTENVRALWKKQLEPLGVTMTVISGTDLRDRGYGGIWNVGKASQTPPALIVLSHTPANASKTVAWVGKGITFDTGGLNLKVGGYMVGMKTDMGGSAAILHAFTATVLTNTNTHFNLHAVLCVAENSLDSRSFRPDDIITGYSGKTIEVTDTDAEGRLVLMDGVAHACKDLNADVVVDMATLTGAQPYATGTRHAGFVSNHRELETLVEAAGRASGDLAKAMLYCPPYLGADKSFKSEVADMINYNAGGSWRIDAPSSSAGMFVGAHLVPEEKWVEDGEGWWAHIDMALPSTINGRASGYGVGILYSLAESLNAKFA